MKLSKKIENHPFTDPAFTDTVSDAVIINDRAVFLTSGNELVVLHNDFGFSMISIDYSLLPYTIFLPENSSR